MCVCVCVCVCACMHGCVCVCVHVRMCTCAGKCYDCSWGLVKSFREFPAPAPDQRTQPIPSSSSAHSQEPPLTCADSSVDGRAVRLHLGLDNNDGQVLYPWGQATHRKCALPGVQAVGHFKTVGCAHVELKARVLWVDGVLPGQLHGAGAESVAWQTGYRFRHCGEKKMGDESGQFTQRLLSSLAGDCASRPCLCVCGWIQKERTDRHWNRPQQRERKTERGRQRETERKTQRSGNRQRQKQTDLQRYSKRQRVRERHTKRVRERDLNRQRHETDTKQTKTRQRQGLRPRLISYCACLLITTAIYFIHRDRKLKFLCNLSH